MTFTFYEKTTEVAFFTQNNIKSGTLRMHQYGKSLFDVEQELQSYRMIERYIRPNLVVFYQRMMIFRILEMYIEEEDDIENINDSGERVLDRRGKEVVITKKSKISQKKQQMVLYIFQEPKKAIQGQKGVKLGQISINDACNKEIRARTIQYIACFSYQVRIPFNASCLDSFKQIIKVIGRYDPKIGAEIKVALFWVPILGERGDREIIDNGWWRKVAVYMAEPRRKAAKYDTLVKEGSNI